MGGCWSQQSIDNEAMLAEVESCSVVERSAGDEVVQNIAGQVSVQGGSSEYVGAYVENGLAHQNTVEPTLLVSNNQTEQPVPCVSPDVQQNSSEPMVDVPIENRVGVSVEEPIIYQTFEEQPIAENTVYQISEVKPVPLPVSNNQFEEIFPPFSSDVHFENQSGNEAEFDVPIETKMTTVVDEPLYQPFKEHSMVERTLHNQAIEEQPVIEQTVHNQIFEEQPVRPTSFRESAVLPTQSSETHASVEVNENIQVEETQPLGHDLGVVFEGRTYRTRVFDPNLNEYVYVG